MPRKKTVVPANVAAALTDDKPRAARVVTVLANPDAANDNPAAPVNDNPVAVNDNPGAVNDTAANDNTDIVNENPSALAPLAPLTSDSVAVPVPASVESLMSKDAETLTAEILALEAHGVSVILEIGKRLISAKDKLSRGDWLPWLERLNISPRYAQRYIRLAREWTNATTLSYLGMSKALSLLALPEDATILSRNPMSSTGRKCSSIRCPSANLMTQSRVVS